MTTSRFSGRGFSFGRLYRDRHHGLLRGVCAGLADFFRVDSLVVRLITVIAFLIFPLATGVLYLIAGFGLKERPEYSI